MNFHSFTIKDVFRYKTIPTFGRSTIRKIRKNVSAMKNLAARDYEDFLQVCNHFQICRPDFTVWMLGIHACL